MNVQTAQGDTACHLASYRGHAQCVQCLAEHGADINITNSKHHTVLDDALNCGHYDIYQYLLAVQDIGRFSLLVFCVSRKNVFPSSPPPPQKKKKEKKNAPGGGSCNPKVI